MLTTPTKTPSARSRVLAAVQRRTFWITAILFWVLILALLLGPSRASALDFNWSFEDLLDSGETISGKVLGLEEGVNVMAMDVVITNDGTLGFSTPQSTIGGAVTANMWTVAGGVITSAAYISAAFDSPTSLIVLAGNAMSGFIGTMFDGNTDPLGFRFGEVEFSPVPEPTSFLLLGLGLVGIGYVMRRKNS